MFAKLLKKQMSTAFKFTWLLSVGVFSHLLQDSVKIGVHTASMYSGGMAHATQIVLISIIQNSRKDWMKTI